MRNQSQITSLACFHVPNLQQRPATEGQEGWHWCARSSPPPAIVVEGGPAIHTSSCWPVVHLLRARSVVTILPYAQLSVQLCQKDEIMALSVSPTYHPAFLRLALQPLLFQCSFATELLRCQTLLISRIQDAATCGSQEMEARARLTMNHLPLTNIYGCLPQAKFLLPLCKVSCT